MKRWLWACLALSLALWLAGEAALALWPLRTVSNPLEVLLLPFSVAAGLLAPARDHHHPAAFYALRSLLAGFAYGTALWGLGTVWRRPLSPGRRLAVASLAGVALYPVLVEPSLLRLRRYELSVAGLPPELDGLKVGHLSDTHYGPLVGLGHIRQAIALLHAEQPDLIVLTGDYVHETPASIPQGIAVLAECRARLGVLAVLGNHDHWEGAEECRREFARHKLRLLDNDRVFLGSRGLSEQPGPQTLALCGVGDLWTDRVDAAAALRDVPTDCPRILLSHNPDVAELIESPHRFDLQLSGHTHGGQVSLPGLGPVVVPSRFGSRYAGGLVQGPRWPVVVSRGVGMTVVPVRFRVPPEVGLVVLRRAP